MDTRMELVLSRNQLPTSFEVQQKKRFLLFIKILFKSLGREETETRDVAKSIVSDCTRRNRLGDPQYSPLMDAIDRRLRGHVGEVHWRRAHMYMQHYMSRDQRAARLPQRTPPLSPRRNHDWGSSYRFKKILPWSEDKDSTRRWQWIAIAVSATTSQRG